MNKNIILILSAFLLMLHTNSRSYAESQPPKYWDREEPLQRPEIRNIARLRFLTTVDFPPFNYVDSGQRLSGFNIDLIRSICAELEISAKCEVQALPFKELGQALETKQGEAIIAGLATNPETRSKYLFSRPYFRFPARFAVQATRSMDWSKSPLPVDGKSIGVLANSAHERMLRSYFPTAKAVTYDRESWMYDDMKSGNIDALFYDAVRMSFWIGGNASANCCSFAGGQYLADDHLGTGLAIAVALGKSDIIEAMNSALKSLEEKGVMSELYLRYFPVAFY